LSARHSRDTPTHQSAEETSFFSSSGSAGADRKYPPQCMNTWSEANFSSFSCFPKAVEPTRLLGLLRQAHLVPAHCVGFRWRSIGKSGKDLSHGVISSIFTCSLSSQMLPAWHASTPKQDRSRRGWILGRVYFSGWLELFHRSPIQLAVDPPPLPIQPATRFPASTSISPPSTTMSVPCFW